MYEHLINRTPMTTNETLNQIQYFDLLSHTKKHIPRSWPNKYKITGWYTQFVTLYLPMYIHRKKKVLKNVAKVCFGFPHVILTNNLTRPLWKMWLRHYLVTVYCRSWYIYWGSLFLSLWKKGFSLGVLRENIKCLFNNADGLTVNLWYVSVNKC